MQNSLSLETPNLFLRASRASDCDDLLALEHDPEVMRFLTDYLMPRGGEDGLWVAHERMSGAFVGWFALMSEEEGVAELGYRLRRAMWGRGLASEGARALVDLGFAEFGYGRIIAVAMAANHASRRVMEKAGLSFARAISNSLDQPDQGDVEYALTRTEWRGAFLSGGTSMTLRKAKIDPA